MRVHKVTYWLVMIFLLLFLLGCGAAKPTAVQVDSGVINDQYKGNTQPGLPKVIKITEEEAKSGVKKVPVKASQAAQEASKQNEVSKLNQTDSGGGDAKPKI